MPTSADLLLDTSGAVPLVNPDAERHHAVLDRTRGLVLGLAGHAAFETYSVLTRLPGTSRLSADAAHRIISTNFPASVLPDFVTVDAVMNELHAARVAGGSVYDGLVGLAARTAGILLLTADRRAVATYAALSVQHEVI